MPELKGAVQQQPKDLIRFPNEVTPSKECQDLLHKLLVQDASKRITLEQFFKHPFIDASTKRVICCVPSGYKLEASELSDDIK